MVSFTNINLCLHLPFFPASLWRASTGKRAVIGRAQSTSGHRWLVLSSGLWHLPDGVYGWKDQAKHTISTEVLKEGI